MKKLFFYTILSLFVIQEGFSQKNNKSFELGVQAYTYRNSFPKGVAATLDTIKSLGFTEIEGGGSRGATVEEFRKMCDERGIKIPSTGAGFEQLEKDPMAIVKNAKVLGSSFVMCAWIPHKGDEFTIEDAKKAVEVFNSAGKILKENGLTFCYHAHGFEFRPYGKGTLLDYLFENTDPAYVSFEMDVLWILHGGGDPVKLLKKYGSRWKLMHVKDLKKDIKGDFSGHTPAENDVVLGTGQADWKQIMKLARKVGIEHYFIEDESNKEKINVPLSIKYIKSMLVYNEE